jgi:hypothetical protein
MTTWNTRAEYQVADYQELLQSVEKARIQQSIALHVAKAEQEKLPHSMCTTQADRISIDLLAFVQG